MIHLPPLRSQENIYCCLAPFYREGPAHIGLMTAPALLSDKTTCGQRSWWGRGEGVHSNRPWWLNKFAAARTPDRTWAIGKNNTFIGGSIKCIELTNHLFATQQPVWSFKNIRSHHCLTETLCLPVSLWVPKLHCSPPGSTPTTHHLSVPLSPLCSSVLASSLFLEHTRHVPCGLLLTGPWAWNDPPRWTHGFFHILFKSLTKSPYGNLPRPST